MFLSCDISIEIVFFYNYYRIYFIAITVYLNNALCIQCIHT